MEREREGEKLRLFSLPNTTVREFNWRERERDLEKIRETRLKYACSIQRTLTRLNEIL